MTEKFIPSHGGYSKLLSYQKAEVVYDATVYFTKRFYSKSDRTVDQMVQAARFGLIKISTYLLFQQIRHLEQDFLHNGGLRERMTKARLSARRPQNRR